MKNKNLIILRFFPNGHSQLEQKYFDSKLSDEQLEHLYNDVEKKKKNHKPNSKIVEYHYKINNNKITWKIYSQ